MKKYIFTESQVKKIIDTQINEGDQERSFIMRVQKFLNEILNKLFEKINSRHCYI